MKRSLFGMALPGVALVALFLIFPGFALAATIRVEARIDGRSQLILKGGTAQWQHFQADAPGDPAGTNLPTTINSVDWTPVWSGPTNGCGGCYSDIFNGVVPAMLPVAQPVTLNAIQARENVSIIQQPALANDYATVVEFNDIVTGGADWYIIELDFPFADEPVPTMGTWGMVLLALVVGLGSAYRIRRRTAV